MHRGSFTLGDFALFVYYLGWITQFIVHFGDHPSIEATEPSLLFGRLSRNMCLGQFLETTGWYVRIYLSTYSHRPEGGNSYH